MRIVDSLSRQEKAFATFLNVKCSRIYCGFMISLCIELLNIGTLSSDGSN